MSRAALRETLLRKERIFSPFFVLGDPDEGTSFELVAAAARAGAPMIELGFAFGDAVADGPDIRAAGRRARAAGMTVTRAFTLMNRLREVTRVPFNLLVYGNLIHARGARRFLREAVDAGASSLLVPDCPHEEGERLAALAGEERLAFCDLIGPATSVDRAVRIAGRVTGFLYRTGRQGVTGAGPEARHRFPLSDVVKAVPCPVCVGFGLDTPRQLRRVWDDGARIAVVGSAIARRIAAVLKTSDPASARRRLVPWIEDAVRKRVEASRNLVPENHEPGDS